MEYSAGLTSKLFWLQKARKTAFYMLQDYDKAAIKAIAWEENIYQRLLILLTKELNLIWMMVLK